MSELDEKIGTYIDALRTKCGQEPDVDLVRKVTIGLGPVIYNADSELVSASDPKEIDRIKQNFLVGKLGLSQSDDLDGAITSAVDTYGRSERQKYRAVIYYLLTKHFGKEGVYA
jgi:hypothetical protein